MCPSKRLHTPSSSPLTTLRKPVVHSTASRIQVVCSSGHYPPIYHVFELYGTFLAPVETSRWPHSGLLAFTPRILLVSCLPSSSLLGGERRVVRCFEAESHFVALASLIQLSLLSTGSQLWLINLRSKVLPLWKVLVKGIINRCQMLMRDRLASNTRKLLITKGKNFH